MCTGLLCPNVVCGSCQDESALNATTVYITLDETFLGCLLGKERNAKFVDNNTVNIFINKFFTIQQWTCGRTNGRQVNPFNPEMEQLPDRDITED